MWIAMRPSRGVISMQWPRTVGDAFVQLANKVEARSDVVDIHKKLPGLEHVLQSVEPTAGVFGVIASPIIDKYLSRPSPAPTTLKPLWPRGCTRELPAAGAG